MRLSRFSFLNSRFERIALIEFKSSNPTKDLYKKDLQKLVNPAESDSETLKYFLQIVENHDEATIVSIEEKTEIDSESPVIKNNPIYVRVYSLSKGEEIVNKEIIRE